VPGWALVEVRERGVHLGRPIAERVTSLWVHVSRILREPGDVPAPAGDLPILDLHRKTAFIFDAQGRMIHESAPDRSMGRRFSFTGCRDGNLAVIRADVPGPVARELDLLMASEPPLADPDAEPVHLRAYRDLLRVGVASVEHYHGLLWVFPRPLMYEDQTELVLSGTSEGDRLLDRLGDVLPASLIDKGFETPEDLWEPWCIAMVNGEIASIAQTVRIGRGGAEVGIDTAPVFRGRGLGAATTAGWSRHPDLAQVTCFYSTGRENSSSRRLAERLRLRFLGATFAVQ
jgi:hypothetical protein